MAGHVSGGSGERAFGGLGRFIVRHPWYPIIFWIIILLVALPFLSDLGGATTNSTTSLPASAPSSIANAAIAQAFPNGTGGSSSIVVLVGPNLTGPGGQAAVMALSSAIRSDPSIQDLSGVSTLYSAYGEYLTGQASIGLSTLAGALRGPNSVLPEINSTSTLIWGPPAAFVADWQANVQAHPTGNGSTWNYPAFEQANTSFRNNASLQLVLSSFYYGYRSTDGGFNGTPDCAADPSTVIACADTVARDNLAALLPRTGTLPSQRIVPGLVLSDLGVENSTSWPAVQALTLQLLGETSGLSTAWLTQLGDQFPTLAPTSAALSAWSEGIVDNGTLTTYPLPVPASLEANFLSSDGRAELLVVDFSQASGYVDSHGAMPIYSDVNEIDRIGPSTVAKAAPSSSLTFYQTGGAALDENENTDLSQTLALVLPLTIIVLIGITMVYFRTPVAPALTFSGIAIALIVGLAGVVLIAHAITKVDVTSLELEDTFVLGVGTDYSIFLVARYREEIVRGVESKAAVIASVTWAGQSIATSGTAAGIATLALAFSGVALLSQWGIVLSFAVLVTVLISLTIVPAFLTLLGPRMFWPNTGARFHQQQLVANEKFRNQSTYFHRAARLSQKRPKTIIALVLLVSVPLIYVAVISPLSYDFYQQIPAGQPATNGLAELNSHFGPGYAFPIEVLVNFSAPLVVGNQTNLSEFIAIDNLTTTFAATHGVATVDSPTGTGGAPLNTWLDYNALPPATQASLNEVLSPFVGVGDRSVLLTVVPNASGLSYTAVTLVNTLSGDIYNFQLNHPSASAVYFGGGAPTTRDLQAQTYEATLRMLLLVAVGLIIVLFAVLRSYILPLLAVATVMLSIGWSWGVTQAVLGTIFGIPLFFFVPTVVIILILGLGIDYNIFVLTRVREERIRGHDSSTAVRHAVASTGGIITAAAIILASAFAILGAGSFLLLRSIGFAVAVAVLLDALVVRTYLVPAILQVLGDRTWQTSPFQRATTPAPPQVARGSTEPSQGAGAGSAVPPPARGAISPAGGLPGAGTERPCPACGEGNRGSAIYCQRCGQLLPPPA